MSAERVYLDHNATTPPLPSAIDAVHAALLLTGNPSSVHGEGRAARAVVEEARRNITHALGGKAENLIFTSGGTESANHLLCPEWAVSGDRRRFSDLFVLSTEHACMLGGGRFAAEDVRMIPVDADGVIQLDVFDSMLSRSRFPLVAIQHANNETGVIQPIEKVAEIARSHLALIVCDAVQSFGKLPVDIKALGVDALFVSAHKIGGPKGVGAILFADSRISPASALINGGGQQKGFRAGTENVSGIAGFGAASLEIGAGFVAAAGIGQLRDKFENDLVRLARECIVFGRSAPRLPNTSLFAIPGNQAETSLIGFDLAGFALSSGSACSSGKVKRSHVLDAMGVAPSLATCAIRFSIGRQTTAGEVQRFLVAVQHRIESVARKTDNEAAQAA